MASALQFVEYAREQMRGAGEITFRKMFGEYAVYCNAKVVALICDNQLFVKPTAAGRARIEEVKEGAPYPGAKPHFLIDEQLDDAPWLAALITATERELPMPAPKKPKAAKAAAKPAPVKGFAGAKKIPAKKPVLKKAAAKKSAVKKAPAKKVSAKKAVKKSAAAAKAARKRA